MAKSHDFTAAIEWTGSRGYGTTGYRDYDRSWRVTTPGKPPVDCSNEPALGGDPALHNPEDLLLSALSACHMLWFLHRASEAGIVITGYRDAPLGIGESEPSGAGRFTAAVLRPEIALANPSQAERADALHAAIHEVCFIARSVAFPVTIEARYVTN
ncbi:OsmC family protein [Sphingomonas sp. Y38-1Y]|uniref:OsmC family protein n=1 Tax=Sphingomonas sp. Y38-1Y TaxID=3078265 RepID=UPI0028E3A22F|nr:OsmC family protein [Sphingomonas sp. Y38-1Y]